ncbi:MAG: hypothetical protein COS90_00440, partial [Deltaproteobacteria bacterium CG07_land_8_20_14_0_80_60_11]
MRDIAAAARIAEGALYRHYSGKDALAWELFSKNYTAFALELHRLQAGQASLRAKLVFIFKIYQRLTQSLTSLAEVLVAATWGVV